MPGLSRASSEGDVAAQRRGRKDPKCWVGVGLRHRPCEALEVGLLEGVHLIVRAGTEIHGRWHCH